MLYYQAAGDSELQNLNVNPLLTIKYCLWHLLISIPIYTSGWVFQSLTFINLPLLVFMWTQLILNLKSLSKRKCIPLQTIYTLILFLPELTQVMSSVCQWKICLWIINYFNRVADRKISAYACMQNYDWFGSLCELQVMCRLGWELFMKDGRIPRRWLLIRSMILFLPAESCGCICSEILFHSPCYILGLLNGKCYAPLRFKPHKWCAVVPYWNAF